MKDLLKKESSLLILFIIFGLLFLVYYNRNILFQKLNPKSPISEINSLIVSTTEIKMSYPLRLKIPAIKVDSAIESVGLTADAAMDVPVDTNNVAWFNLGVIPGEEGSAVIAGHFDNKSGQAAVFYNLEKLNKGDQLFIEDNQGQLASFEVKEKRLYDSTASTPEVFYSNSGKHLNLITCAGSWDNSQESYNKRLIIFTDRIK